MLLTPRWLNFGMGLAKFASQMSKDPSTKVGAALLRRDMSVAAVSFNGFPRNTSDSPRLYGNRDVKYSRIVHAEMNAILAVKEHLNGCILFSWPIPPCDRCSVHIVQSGIKRVVLPSLDANHRWAESCRAGQHVMASAGIEIITWNLP